MAVLTSTSPTTNLDPGAIGPSSKKSPSILLISALVLLQLASQAPTASCASLAKYSSRDVAAMQHQLPWRAFTSKQRPLISSRRNILGAGVPDLREEQGYFEDAGEKLPRSIWQQKKSTNLSDYTRKVEDAETRVGSGEGPGPGMSKRGFNVIPRFINHLTSVPGRKLMGLQQRSSWSSEDWSSRGGPRQFRLRWG